MMERFLAPHEAAIDAAGVRVILSCDVEGDLDDATLGRALDHLWACSPLLAGKISQGREGRPLVRIEDTAPGLVLGHGEDFDEEINTPLAWDRGPLLRLTVLREAGCSRVVMTLPRAFVDGMSYLSLHQRLWDTYTALTMGGPLPGSLVQPVLGPALDDLLAARFTPEELRDFVAERAQLDSEAPPALVPALASRDGRPGTDTRFRIIGIDTDAEQTKRLVQLARGASLSLNALVSGILLTSLRFLLPATGGPARLLCTTAVDMRRRLTPPLSAEVLQSAATTTSIRLEVSTGTHPVAAGQALAARLRADLDSGAAAMELAAFPYMLDQHPPSLVITNVGTITEPDLPPGLRISNIRLAPLGHVPMVFVVVSRYQGRLAIDLTYSHAWYTDDQMQDLAHTVTATIDTLTAGEPQPTAESRHAPGQAVA
ncbi:condensation protein [Streptomyces sp. NBC_00654]|uniref:phthiocerol/phthiodiolone dimycocerosyl transferase family protein n=1 Tax=Streptomyces sp. NBC_00654 TaxID=2975799 RepID=UPI002256F0A0|nr:condensation protein [Streptomyces sp. NBC_00654]MCX4966881.1 condensation protein [Streptomyces sp. NBC_00654]